MAHRSLLKSLNKSLFLLPVIFLVFIFYSGCKKSDTSTNPNPGTGNSNQNQVLMQGNRFSPAGISVTAGTTVTWVNKDSYAHTVTSGSPGSPDGKFDSGTIEANGTYSYKFDTKGTFSYYCKIHQDIMTGTVTVQ
ncbi:MAG: plastocyanin/azurin family copper-binding protein [Syntrophothermus sp.]